MFTDDEASDHLEINGYFSILRFNTFSNHFSSSPITKQNVSKQSKSIHLKEIKRLNVFIFSLFKVSFMHQTTGDLLSLGSELLVDKSLNDNHIKLVRLSSNRLDLNLFSVNQNDSGLYTCMHNDEKLSSFLIEIFGKCLQNRLNKDFVVHLIILFKKKHKTKKN